MPIQVPQWADYLNCPACCREFAPPRSPVSLGCGHTLCKICINNLHRKQCPFDQTEISVELEELVVNTALLQLAGFSPPAQAARPPRVQALPDAERAAYDLVVKCLEQLAVFLKCCGNANVNGSRLSRPMQRKLVSLLQCAVADADGRGKAARAARSLGERTVTELLLQHQNPQQLSANLWAAVRSRGCQFLGPAMQEEVLKLVILALEDGSALSRKVLVMFVVQRLEPHFPQASKTSIGHVVQLLYRASCFMVSKRERDSSLMQLKEEFRTYEALRREHDAQIVQIATEAGLRIAPDQWSALLYGDTQHKSHMQSIIDKLQTPQSFAQSVQELLFALQRTGDPAQLIAMNIALDRLASIDASPDAKSPDWLQLADIMTSLKEVVSGLVKYMQHLTTSRDANHNPTKILERLAEPPVATPTPVGVLPGRYKVAMCRDAQNRTYCPRGNNCTYAHSEEELERYRMGHAGTYPVVVSFNLAEPAPGTRPIYTRYPGPPPPAPPIMPLDNMANYNVAPVYPHVVPSERRSVMDAAEAYEQREQWDQFDPRNREQCNPQDMPPGVQHNPHDLPPGVQYNLQPMPPGVQYNPPPMPPGVQYMPQEMSPQQQYAYEPVQAPMPAHEPALENQHQNGGNENYAGSYANALIHGNNNGNNNGPAARNGNPPVYYRPYYYRYPQPTENGDDPSNIWVVPPPRASQADDIVNAEYPRAPPMYADETPPQAAPEEYSPQAAFEGDYPSQAAFEGDYPPQAAFEGEYPPQATFEGDYPPQAAFEGEYPPQAAFEGFSPQTYEEFGQAAYGDNGQAADRRRNNYTNWSLNLILGMDNLRIGSSDLAGAINDERELEKELLALEERITTELAKGSEQDFKGEA